MTKYCTFRNVIDLITEFKPQSALVMKLYGYLIHLFLSQQADAQMPGQYRLDTAQRYVRTDRLKSTLVKKMIVAYYIKRHNLVCRKSPFKEN